MTRYMLDTNTASYIMRDQVVPPLKLLNNTVLISVISEAEILFGLEKNKAGERLQNMVREFMSNIDVLKFDRLAGQTYAVLKKNLRQEGLALAHMDMLIAAHSLAVDAILVTSDQAFYKASHLLKLENWLA